MENAGLVALAAFGIGYGLISRRLSTTAVTGPLAFTAFGLLLGPPGLEWLGPEAGFELVTLLLETTLVVILFTDAYRIDIRGSSHPTRLPGRLLGIGLPLMMFGGWLAARGLFPALGPIEAALLAVLLAPTDAALGQAVISNPRVPKSIRNTLNIESGLNDGLALPVFFVLLEAAELSEAGGGAITASELLASIGVQVGLAVIVGLVVGIGFARLGGATVERNWAEPGWVHLAMLGSAIMSWGIADGVGASGFIAAWVTGLSCGMVGRHRLGDAETLEDFSGLLTLLSFGIFGAVGLGDRLASFDLTIVAYALLSLAVIRLVAVAVATGGTHLGVPSKAYLGWFGPRGLASMILALIVVGDTDLPGTQLIVDVTIATVALSILLHGVTAWWGSNRYADWWESLPASRRAREEGVEPETAS